MVEGGIRGERGVRLVENGSERRRSRWLRPLVIAIAACAIAFCGWSIAQYAAGTDPLAWLASQDAFQTTEQDPGDASPGQASDDANATSDTANDAQGDATASSEAGSAEDSASTTDGSDAQASSAGASGEAATSAGSSSDSATTSSSDGTSDASSASGTGYDTSADASSSAAQPSPSGQDPSQQPQTMTVTVTVDGSPAGGSTHTATVELSPGANAYDALVAADGNINARDTVYGTYVAAIDGLAEKEHGSMSGWVYAVNGVEPNTACSNYVLSAGDTVVWTYVNVE